MKPNMLLVALVAGIFVFIVTIALLPSCGTARQSSRVMSSYAPPSSVLSEAEIAAAGESVPGEELWIISKFDDGRATDKAVLHHASTAEVVRTLSEAFGGTEIGDLPEPPGCGSLVCFPPIPVGTQEQKLVPIPLKHTEVSAQISAYISSVKVQQQFHNPYDGKIEAVYVFPLPQNAAVNEFLMTVGDRTIRGIIREREEAERIYKEARAQGYVASLLTQERPNIFTQKVANIEPGKSIDIDITYFHTLAYRDGGYEFVFPMVVGPRFNPPTTNDGVGAVARGAHGASGQRTEVQYLAPAERSGHDIGLTVRIDAGVSIESISSLSHVVEVERPTPSRAVVRLSKLDSIPNKDFVLRYKIAGREVKTALLTHRNERGGFFTLMLVPPAELGTLERAPMEMIFVLDCSGSMSGQPIAQARRAVERALRQMTPEDTFQVIRFSNNASKLGPAPLPATKKNVRRGVRYVQSLHSSGGTMMIEGIKAALDFPHDEQRLRTVAFLTDGYIGNETDILRAVHERLGEARIFSFGVGSSPNRYLMARMAKMGQGAVAYVGLNDSAAEVMDAYMDRISHPALRDIKVNWPSGARVSETYPRRIPDLFTGRPVILTGRFEGELDGPIHLVGRLGDETRSFTITTGTGGESSPALASVWARQKIADLFDQAIWDAQSELPDQIKRVALEYSLMSAYTAFVAVDSLTRTDGEFGTTVAVPVPVPVGTRYVTTVSGVSN
jgi:Ca-activated chloride channel family protein